MALGPNLQTESNCSVNNLLGHNTKKMLSFFSRSIYVTKLTHICWIKPPEFIVKRHTKCFFQFCLGVAPSNTVWREFERKERDAVRAIAAHMFAVSTKYMLSIAVAIYTVNQKYSPDVDLERFRHE